MFLTSDVVHVLDIRRPASMAQVAKVKYIVAAAATTLSSHNSDHCHSRANPYKVHSASGTAVEILEVSIVPANILGPHRDHKRCNTLAAQVGGSSIFDILAPCWNIQ